MGSNLHTDANWVDHCCRQAHTEAATCLAIMVFRASVLVPRLGTLGVDESSDNRLRSFGFGATSRLVELCRGFSFEASQVG